MEYLHGSQVGSGQVNVFRYYATSLVHYGDDLLADFPAGSFLPKMRRYNDLQKDAHSPPAVVGEDEMAERKPDREDRPGNGEKPELPWSRDDWTGENQWNGDIR